MIFWKMRIALGKQQQFCKKITLLYYPLINHYEFVECPQCFTPSEIQRTKTLTSSNLYAAREDVIY